MDYIATAKQIFIFL